MKSIWSLRGPAALAVSAAMLVSGVAAASASADAPEYTPAGNTFILHGGAARFEGGPEVACERVEGAMTLESWWNWRDTLTFTGCKLASIAKCWSEGAKAGEISTTGNILQLVYLRGGKEVGVIFNYDSEPGHAQTWFTFSCGPKTDPLVTDTVRGSVIAKLTPVDTLTKTFTLELKASKEKQEITEYESLENHNEPGTGELLKAGLENSANDASYKGLALTISPLEIAMEYEGEIIN